MTLADKGKMVASCLSFSIFLYLLGATGFKLSGFGFGPSKDCILFFVLILKK